ncbi:uncharacterized protein eIF2Bdelta [Periplaneta americana]|uniref:uncharacterized protein eIF2Bdelta n=1 Tax=Periplaneta americana TaxID=6978 RepID=UPI0037E8F30C
METKQARPGTAEKDQHKKTSNKKSQKKKATDSQSRPGGGGGGGGSSSSNNTKTQKVKGEGVSVPKQGSKGSSAVKKSKDKTERDQSVNKENVNKDDTKKSNRKKNKKSVDVTQKPHTAPLTGKSENSDQSTGNKTKEAGCKKGSSVHKTEQIVVQSPLNFKEDKQKIQTEEVTPKSGSELSKSKKRRIRKRRVLESLGIIVNAVKSPKDKTSTKKRKKKKKAKHSTVPDASEDFLLKDNTNIKPVTVSSEINGLVTSRDKDNVCDTLGNKGAVRKCEETANTTPKVKDTSNTHLKKTLDQVNKVKETKIEKKVLSENLLDVKGRHSTQDSNTSAKVCSNCEELQCKKQEEESQISDSKILSDDIPHQSLNKKEESGKVDLVNFLSHDNVEGLFRSALLNDVTLSSRCSEKEVKNFFNTYGTFSERGRTQFAAVEKLLHSSNKDSEDITASQCFEPTLDKEVTSTITPQHSNIIVNKESNLDSNSSAINVVGSQKCDYFSPKHIKVNINSDEPVSVASVSNLESSYNQVVKGLSRLESVGNNLVYKGGLSRGPIYTSPNLENRVTSSANSSQTLNSASKIFTSNTHESCNAKEEDKSESSEIPESGKLDSPLVNTEKDLLGQEKVVDQFLQKDKTPSSEVVNASETNIKLIHHCNTKAKEELPIKDQVSCHTKVSDVKAVKNEIDIVGSYDVIECTKNKEKSVTEILPESSKDPVSICPSLNESKGSSWEKDDLENLPEKIEKNCTERYRWTGFVSESEEDTQETGFEATISVKSVIPIKKVEDNKNIDNSTELNSAVSKGNEDKELSDLATESVKEQKEKTCDALPVYGSGKEVSDSTLLSSSIPLIEDQATMKSMQGKTTESTNFQRAEKNKEEIKAAREAKKAEKAIRNKSKATSATTDGASKSTENAAIKKQAVPNPSKNKQSSRTGVDSGKSLNEPSTVCATLQEPTLKNIGKAPSVEKDIKSVKDNSVKISKIENKVAGKKKDLQEAKEVSEEKKGVPVSLKGDEINRTVEKEGKINVAENVENGDPSVAAATAGKSRAELRAERRAKQEQQRAVKAAQQQVKVSQVKSATIGDSNLKNKQPQKDTGEHVNKKAVKVAGKAAKLKTPEHRVKLFNHLYNERGPLAITENSMIHGPEVHPAVMKLGLQFADRIVVGSNARCIALLDALKQVIRDYETPPQKEFSRGLEAELQPSVNFLHHCRPLSVSMTNALRHLMRQMRQLPNNVSDSEAKKKLLETIDVYIREQIEVADQAICNMVQKKIANGDVILTYGCSSLLQRILLEAHDSGTKFRVIVVDGRPWLEGREMLRWLVESGLDCSYVLVSAASFIMREVTKVLLGAHALLANGYVMSRAGSSQVALLAHSYNVPVLVCCETHKFCERVQTDSFVYNELGNPDDLIPKDSSSKEFPLSKWRSIESLTPLNLTYDVTPPDLVTAVVTELAILPCTSVPVILRIKPTETGC